MAGFSDYLEDKVLDHVFGGTAYTAPSTLYVALYTVAPTDTGGGTEVSGGGYEEKPQHLPFQELTLLPQATLRLLNTQLLQQTMEQLLLLVYLTRYQVVIY